MNTEILNCDNCYDRHVTSEAIEWCPVCEEALCGQCKDHHNASKLAKSHKTMSVSDYRKLPPFILDVKTYCEMHDYKYELFCTFHQEPCCTLCVKENHKECNNFDTFQDVVKNIKSSSAFEDVEQSVYDIIENFGNIIKNRQNNKSRLLEQKKDSLQEIHAMRLSVDELLDRIEKSMKEEVVLKIDEAVSAIDASVHDLSNRMVSIVICKEDIAVVKALATESQTFFGLEKIRCKINEDLLYQRALAKDVQEVDMSVDFSAAVKAFSTEAESFGCINIVSFPMSTKLVERKKDQAQLMKPKGLAVDNINLLMQSLVETTEGCDIVDGTVLPSGKLVFCNKTPPQIIVNSQKGGYMMDIEMEHSPCAITFMKDSTVAVTFTKQQKVVTYDLWLGNVTGSFKTSKKCYGIAYRDKKFCIRITGNFIFTDTQGLVLQTIPATDCKSFVSLANNMIYSSNTSDNKVLCYNSKGELLWVFEHKILKSPTKITTDKVGRLFVAGKSSHNVVVISPDGAHFKEILKIKNVSAIDFENESRKLLVCTQNTERTLLCDICYGNVSSTLDDSNVTIDRLEESCDVQE